MLKSNKVASFAISLIAFYSLNVYADPNTHIVVAPQCLTKNLNAAHKTLASAHSLSLIQLNKNGIDELIQIKANQKTLCGGFVDVSNHFNEFNPKNISRQKKASLFLEKYNPLRIQQLTTQPHAYSIKYSKQVNEMFKTMSPDLMWQNLINLSSMKDRYANSDNGVAAANWFKNQIEQIARDNNRNDVTVTMIATGRYKQPSVVVKVGNASEAGIVVGAHMDTLSGKFNRMPGADDDGSGSVTVLETARVLLSSGKTFKKPIYFIWYAAEEQGLVGSGYVVSEFKKKNIPIEAVLHFDLTGYAYNNEPTMWLIDDYVNKDLVAYLDQLIQTYVKKPTKHTVCGYACSDHASWTQGGYPAAMPAESAFEDTNPDIHSSNDTVENLSLSHMTDYLKLGVAFAMEMAEPTV